MGKRIKGLNDKKKEKREKHFKKKCGGNPC